MGFLGEQFKVPGHVAKETIFVLTDQVLPRMVASDVTVSTDQITFDSSCDCAGGNR